MNGKSLLSVVVCLMVPAALLSAQSLAEIAAQEKKRREKLPATKVIRDEDLPTSGTGSASETEENAEPATTPAPAPSPAQEEVEKAQSDWPSVFADCRSRYDAAKALRDQKLDLIVNGLPIGTDLERIPCARIMINEFTPGWVRYAIDCERLEKEVGEQEATMRSIQDECYDAARVRWIPPGEARLD